ncbi:unnamed protein product [Calypogeia fissa]
MSFQWIKDYIWSLNHDDDENWGNAYEIAFWVFVLVAHFALVIYAAWNLAKKHTEATGSSVLVEVKPDEPSASASGDSSLLGGTTRRRNKGGLSRFFRSS